MTISSPTFLKRVEELSRASDLVWIIGLVSALGFTLIGAHGFAFSESGKLWAYASLILRAGLYLWSGDALRGRGGEVLSRLLRLGMVAGFAELLVDWALIHWVSRGRLVYLSGNDVVLLGSPIWMPLAWACVIVELGYLAMRLFGALRPRLPGPWAAVAASVITAVSAGLMVGFYEYFAYRASWWRYEPANAMIGDFCALYIPLGEVFMFLPVLPIVARGVSRDDRPAASAVESGALLACAIAAGYALAYAVLEAGRGAG
ncbi:MAG: hypothetical protein IT372_31840 [Polyangiaceae bacterium]|nr:hypothetical protein [Polyangiaceae bacterium]